MPKDLRVVGPADTWAALRAVLSGDGPAIVPRPADATGTAARPTAALPATVDVSVAAVIETSGSTGRPKRVVLGRDALLASASASESALGGPGQWLLALPTHYVAGLNVLVRSIASDTTPVSIEHGPFTPESFLRAADAMSNTARFVSLVPTQLARLLDSPDATAALRRFDRVLVGGQATGERLRARAIASGVRMTTSYGSSETSGGCVYDGQATGSTSVAIHDGEVWLAGPTLADGYLGDPERTASAFVTDGGVRWYRTGDAGLIVDETLRVTGRFDDVIISGGEKVSLGELERLVRELPSLADAVVVAAADEDWGHVPIIFTTNIVDEAALRSAIVARLGRAASPARVIVLDAIPFLPSGKPDRAQLVRRATR